MVVYLLDSRELHGSILENDVEGSPAAAQPDGSLPEPVSLQRFVGVPRYPSNILEALVFDRFDPAEQLQHDVTRHLLQAPLQSIGKDDATDHGSESYTLQVYTSSENASGFEVLLPADRDGR
jgi:hypothetical protein